MRRIIKHIKKGFEIQNARDALEIIVALFEIVGVIATVWSVLLVYDTLIEMQIERNNSYRPSIYFSKKEFIIQTSEDMSVIDPLKGVPIFSTEDMETKSYDKLTLDVRNIGVGSAKDVKITIDRDACINAIDEFNDASLYCKMRYGNRDEDPHYADWLEFGAENAWDCISEDDEYSYGENLDDAMSLLYFDDELEIPYILPNAEQEYEYALPTIYYCLINAMRIEFENVNHVVEGNYGSEVMIPDIYLNIEYSDVQGVKYQEKAVIHTNAGWIFGGGFSLIVSLEVM